jgi:hypothetical protein
MSSLQQGSTSDSATISSISTSEDNLEQWNIVLTTIRANLDLIVSTWGRDSKQYREAKEVMLEYLEENVTRLRGGARETQCEHMEGVQNGKGVLQKGIEELMVELRL